MGLSIWVPAAYLGFLAGSLWLFSKIYRKRQLSTFSPLPPS